MSEAEPPDLERLWLDRVENIRVWSRRHERAVNKPLLLLLALARIQRGEDRETGFSEIEAPLRNLLERYGPSRSSYHPEYPFWYLKNDGVWQVAEAESLPLKKSGGSPRKSDLIARDVHAGISREFDALLRANPALLARSVCLLLDLHFPDSYHDALLTEIGLDLSASDESAFTTSRRRKRDPTFRPRVLRAYAYRCAVCGFDLAIDGRSEGLDAAHVWWHTHGGRNDIGNGLALCPVHHRTLDLGAWGMDDARRMIVSKRASGGPALTDVLLRHHGRPISPPQEGEPPVTPDSVRWHRHEVFRDPPRPIQVA